ncbi:MAG TPA: hypothetical protein VL634_09985 [Mycobacterium sp.]|jgi:cytochrome bd-type quinol oxidase subunit 2|nr:hypothetical protein [Mycobacterium sp.]
MTAVDRRSTEEASRAAHITNWVLALATIPGAIAVVAFLYMQIMGTAGCTHQPCPRTGPGELGFVLIQYGAPAVAVIAVVLSFFTARRRRGIVVPAVAWLLLIAAVAVLAFSFTPTG